MWKCILGERNCGKSVYVENQVKKSDQNALYIATLPDLELYRSAITRHKERRPATWKCIELFKMSREEIIKFPYSGYQNVILDNLSYYLLYQLYFCPEEWSANDYENMILLIKKVTDNTSTTVYFIDTPIDMNVLDTGEKALVQHFFNTIFDGSKSIEKFHSEVKIDSLSVEEAKQYFFHIDAK